MRYVIFFLRGALLLVALFIAWNFLSLIVKLYNIEWYSENFENDLAYTYMSNLFMFQLMFLFRFPKIRYLLIIVGLFGVVAMTMKLHFPPVNIVEGHLNWPSEIDIKSIRFSCGLLLVEGIIFNYVSCLIDFIVIKPVRHVFLLFRSVFRRIV